MRIRFPLAVLAAFLFLAPVAAHADIVIGVAAPFTGNNAFFGDQMKHGAEQAVADINARGGVLGQKLALQMADDACDPKQAVAVANRFASDGVKFVVGHVCSNASIPASKVYNDEGVFMITPTSTNPALTDAGYKMVFRTCGRDDQQGPAVARYILKHFHDKRIAVTNDQSTWGLGIASELEKTLHAAGVKEVLDTTFMPGQQDYSAFISRLKQAGVQIVFLGGFFTEVGLIVRQMKQQGAHMQVIGGDALVTDQFWSITGPAGEGVLMSFAPDPRKSPQAQAVLAAFRRDGYEPEGYTLYAYAAVQVIAEGIQRAGVANPMKIAAALRQKPVKTVIGTLDYDTKGDVKGYKYVIYRWHEGKYVEAGE